MISVRNLQFQYPNSPFELSVPRFELEAGQHTAIVGPSGCGKTTFLNLLAGIIPWTEDAASEFQFCSVPLAVSSSREMRRFRNESVGFVFQDFRLLEYLSIKDNILLPVTLSSNARGIDWDARVEKLITKVGLEMLRDRPVSKLSRGEQQRVAVCRALLREPALVLADEPTANLDGVNARGVWDLLFEQSDEIGSTIIAVTHGSDGLEHFKQRVSFEEINFGGKPSLE
ncbi:MAG: ABC transporter ATP-binding protein [Planctomycetaceae bacterium]|nr:ABC transporter ATP-binding protein [Planctomycetaceae bacterium]